MADLEQTGLDEGFLIPDAEFQEVLDAFYAFRDEQDDVDRSCELKDNFVNEVKSLAGSDDDKMRELYGRLVSACLLDFVKLMRSEYFSSIFGAQDVTDVVVDRRYLGAMKGSYQRIAWFNAFKGTDFENRSPFMTPFDEIDRNDPKWASIINIAENFEHAFLKAFGFNYMWGDLDMLNLGDRMSMDDRLRALSHLQLQGRAYKGLLRLLEQFSDLMLGISRREDVRVADVVNLWPDMLKYRVVDNIPIEVHCPDDLMLHGVAPGDIHLGGWEVGKNSADKAGDSPREYFAALDEYMVIRACEFEVRGRKLVAIEVMDQGARIDLNKVRDSLGIPAYAYRDYKVGELIDMLSQRGLSIPMIDGKKRSTGIGFHSAVEAAQRNNGDIYCTNLPEKGVASMIVIPANGKDSGFQVSEMDLTGEELDDIAGQMVASGMFDEGIAERLVGYFGGVDCGDDMVSGPCLTGVQVRDAVTGVVGGGGSEDLEGGAEMFV